MMRPSTTTASTPDQIRGRLTLLIEPALKERRAEHHAPANSLNRNLAARDKVVQRSRAEPEEARDLMDTQELLHYTAPDMARVQQATKQDAKTRHPRVNQLSGLRKRHSASSWDRQLRKRASLPRESLLFAAQAVLGILDAAFQKAPGKRARKTLLDGKTIAWEHIYKTEPAAFGNVLQALAPGVSLTLPPEAVNPNDHDSERVHTHPRADTPVSEWGRYAFGELVALNTVVDKLLDRNTGLVSDETLAGSELRALPAAVDAPRLELEIRATLHNAVALMTSKRSMSELVEAAKRGDDNALLTTLRINPELIELKGIATRVHLKVRERDLHFLQRLQRAIALAPVLDKNAKLGFIIAGLWELGLKWLPASALRAFLQEAGLPSVPKSAALERYTQRLGLRKYSTE